MYTDYIFLFTMHKLILYISYIVHCLVLSYMPHNNTKHTQYFVTLLWINTFKKIIFISISKVGWYLKNLDSDVSR